MMAQNYLIWTAGLGLQNTFTVGIHGGAVLDYVISQGYNFSFIGCTTEPGNSTIDEKWKKLLLNRFNYKTNPEHPWPIMALCIGKGINNTNSPADKYVTESGDVFTLYCYVS